MSQAAHVRLQVNEFHGNARAVQDETEAVRVALVPITKAETSPCTNFRYSAFQQLWGFPANVDRSGFHATCLGHGFSFGSAM
ncbi:hypothetical protein BaRGS_00011488 [Batillaria attramentaria]|uniref:Uncharacterized protein n=1 Tax=Batillaria attramentaria TaxID=370345 RepID=A0ABD0LCL8_9CAEN